MEQLDLYWTDIHEILYMNIFKKYVKKIQVSLKFDKNNQALYMKTNIHFLSYHTQFFLEWGNVSDKSCWANQNMHFILNFFFRKSCRLWDNVEEYCRARQATDDNMVHVHCMLDN
jgi:hypothetical protein